MNSLLWHYNKITGLNNLWSNVLRSKYSSRPNQLQPLAFSTDTYIWKGMVKAHVLFSKDTTWSKGDGSNICLWNDHWINYNYSPHQLINRPLPNVINNQTLYT